MDGVELKIDWEFAAERTPNQVSNFCCRTNGKLIGYALLEGDGPALEVTAAVASQYRRQGIFTGLLRAVKEEAQRRKATSLLAVSYRASASGTAAMQALGLAYISSEYRMEAEEATMPVLPEGILRLVQVDASNAEILSQITALTFGRISAALDKRLQQDGSRYFLAELDGAWIGQIGVVNSEGSIYIRGVGILPEYQRRGYGRQLLAATLKQMLLEKFTSFLLDVATDNPQALSLYYSCGFFETTIYD
ncbi:MAG: GNAT family N-acetyltransferase [Janthinobacterium lividum]